MKVIFENSRGEERVIANVKNEDEGFEEIKKFCSDRNFEIYYIRKWKVDNRMKYDVGSHSEFFYIEDDEV